MCPPPPPGVASSGCPVAHSGHWLHTPRVLLLRSSSQQAASWAGRTSKWLHRVPCPLGEAHVCTTLDVGMQTTPRRAHSLKASLFNLFSPCTSHRRLVT